MILTTFAYIHVPTVLSQEQNLMRQDFIKSFEGRRLPVPREDMLPADITEEKRREKTFSMNSPSFHANMSRTV